MKQKFLKNKDIIRINFIKKTRKTYFIYQKTPLNLFFQNSLQKKKNIFLNENFNFLLKYFLKKGKKLLLENLFKKSLIYWIKYQSNKKFFSILNQAYLNTSPKVGVITKRKGSKNIYIPYRLTKKKRFFKASSWIILNTFAKKKRKFFEGLIDELIECSLRTSSSVKKCEELLKLAEDNLNNLKKIRLI